MSTLEKRCCVCRDDVANKKRVKDPRGKYYCDPCFQHKRAATAAPVPAAAGADVDRLPDLPSSAPADDGLLDLAPVVKAPVDQNMFGCSACKKLVPERLIRNIDGEFACKPCIAKREGATRLKPAATSTSKIRDPEEEDNRERWSHSLTGGAIISIGVLVAACGIFFLLNLMWPANKHFSGVGIAAIFAVVYTVFLVFRTVGLMFSMIIAARIMGGISFGYLGPAIYKTLSLLTAFTVLEILMEHSESLGMLGIGFKGVLLILGFIVLFQIDYFEAMILAIINFFLNFALAFGMLILFATIAGWFSGNSDRDDSDFEPHMRQVAPHHNDMQKDTENANPGQEGQGQPPPDAPIPQE